MFGYEKNDTYQKAKLFNLKMLRFLKTGKIDWYIKNQIQRASLSIMLNIAEGTGRFTKADQRRFMIMARSSIFEVMATLELIKECKGIDEDRFHDFYKSAEEISKILYSTIKTLGSMNK